MKRNFLKTELIELENGDNPADIIRKTYSVQEVRMMGKSHCIIFLEETQNSMTLSEIELVRQENIRLKQYILELDREAQTGETK